MHLLLSQTIPILLVLEVTGVSLSLSVGLVENLNGFPELLVGCGSIVPCSDVGVPLPDFEQPYICSIDSHHCFF